MNKSEFVTLLADRCEVSKKEAEEMYDDVCSTMAEAVSNGEEITIAGLGRVKFTDRAARTAHNPRTGEPVEVPAKKAPKFQFSKNIKEAVASL